MTSTQQLWALMGYYTDPYGYDEDREEIVALFTSKQKAEAYIKNAKLKQRTRGLGGVFKQRSLLARYRSAYVEEYHPEVYDIDPTL